jgi:SMODS-associated and fused to various effectors sensor domain
MTDATGRSFLSYRRTRSNEAALLIAAQHDHGIPTWHDQKDLTQTPTADELHRTLIDSSIANALLWITPDVNSSDVIRKIEVPGILSRVRKNDGFFLVPVCAGGLDYKGAAEAVDQQLSADNLAEWNLAKVSVNPISEDEAAEIALRVLNRRVGTVSQKLDADLPLQITLHTRTRPAFQSGTALAIDWTERFTGREARPDMWQTRLLPAISEVANAIRISAGARTVVASGLAAIPAATALGAAFLAPRGQKIAWRQYTAGRAEQLWSLEDPRVDTEFMRNTTERDVSATDLAVLVSVSEDVEPAFAQTPNTTLPAFRAITRVYHPNQRRFDITSSGQAVDIALTVTEAIRSARDRYRPLGTIHLFMSVPLGVAMLIGQLLNTFGFVQTYEHIPTDSVGVYHPAALLRPSA